MNQRKKSNDAGIQKSWTDVNEIFNSESDERRVQREGEQRSKRVAQLRQQAVDVMSEGDQVGINGGSGK